MARFFALSPRIFLPAAVGCLLSGFSALSADLPASAPTNAPPANVKPPPADASNKPAPPVPPQDPFNRYGNILQPGVEPAHPLRLALPFPDVGEIKLPTQDELTMREKLETLAMLSDDQIRAQLSKWPPFTKMSLRDEALFLARIQDFRDRRSKIAQKEANDLGLPTLSPEQQALFLEDRPDLFVPVHGGWGRMGATHIRLAGATEDELLGALKAAHKLRTEKNTRSKPKKKK